MKKLLTFILKIFDYVSHFSNPGLGMLCMKLALIAVASVLSEIKHHSK